jgi:adenylosuccinate synthase
MDGEKKHVFSNFGSGTLQGVPTYWSPYCTIDPVGVINEYKILKDKGIEPKLYIDSRCPVTTPYDKRHNQSKDQMNGNLAIYSINQFELLNII